ncbi:DUF2911 domain-containing protein [Seonamhaeicola aphaedonensis]|uniref:Uncharacterized protein n=1 Tax=Seonamhaeicola aphaedonensis TaxID=1461338 RepID=A0A3D9HFJ1_9FLAO|nr:DUF2911 domain-containing protein [Seonamhaeicola aphaedonensis]RED48234.1 hypothetical protein DFQ02_10473 [Seonamhaeicola aphaedonensis]
MKKLLLLFMAFATISVVSAQVETPAPSPSAKLEQKVGLTDITIEYSRPGVKGRTIFGELEPWGTIWRTGANKNTTITFSDDITFAGTEVKAGTYAIYTRLNSATNWDVILYSDTNNWGTPQNWEESKVVASAQVEVEEIPFNVETFAIDINHIKNDSAILELIWEKSYAAVPFTVPTDAKVSKSIEAVMGGPSAQDYFASAVYYLESGKDIEKAVKWVDKAVEMTSKNPRFWFIHQQALIHAKAGDKKGAIEAAKSSLELAKKQNYAPYIKKNEDVLKEWGAL